MPKENVPVFVGSRTGNESRKDEMGCVVRIIISPAKKMNVDTDSLPPKALPRLLSKTERLLQALRAMEPQALQRLWKCNDSIAGLNRERLRFMDLRQGLTPALLSY